MSAIQDKSNLAIILALVVSTGGYFIGNTDDAITLDAIDAIKENIEDIEAEQQRLRTILEDHKAIGAHAAQEQKSHYFEKMIDELDERVRNIEIFGTKKLD